MLPYYRILGVERQAGAADIKSAYRRLARKFHPDYNKGHTLAEARFRLLAEAYDVLSDGDRRQRYDRYGQAALVRGGGRGGVVGGVERFVSNLESIVEARLKRVPRRGEDRRRVLAISLADACHGTTTTVEIERRGTCERCSGSRAEPGTETERCHVCTGAGEIRRGGSLLGVSEPCSFCQGFGVIALRPCSGCDGDGERVTTIGVPVEIPPGVERGRRLVLRGRGEPGVNGAEAGDLFLELKITTHSLLVREGYDLHCTVPIRLSEALFGATLDVPLLKGDVVRIKVPPGAASGQTMRLRGRGAPRRTGVAGDLLVHLEVETPQTRDPEVAALLERLDRMSRYPRREAYERSVAATGPETP